MLKRIMLSVILALALITTVPTQAHAAYSDGAAIGAAFMGGFPASTSLGITGQFKGVPLMFGASARILFGGGYTFFGIGFTMDWWGLKIPLLAPKFQLLLFTTLESTVFSCCEMVPLSRLCIASEV